jgi:myo-inositol-1(or 4)-monophosphatase
MASIESVAREAARVGGEIVMKYLDGDFTVREKRESDLVSDADTASERAMVEVIRRSFPGHAVLGEELHQADTSADELWVIDPLDGTTNFVHRIPHFAISVGFYREGRAECGVVYNPARGDWFTATRGGGAFHNGEPARVSTRTTLETSLVGTGFYYDRGAMMEATLATMRALFQHGTHGIRRFGTAALDLCMVGTGLFGGFFEYELAPWDFGAGRLFVEEAGGRVTTCHGEEMPLERTTILASNGPLHEAMLELVKPFVPAGR